MDFMHPWIKMSVKREPEICQTQASRPTSFSVKPKQLPPPSKGDQERPREGRLQMEENTGRLA